MFARLEIRQQMPDGLVLVPHGWWKLESAKGAANLSGARAFPDAQLSDDGNPNLMEQGVPHLKGIPSRVEKLSADELAELEATFGPTRDLPLGPRPEILQSDRKSPEDFMYDPQGAVPRCRVVTLRQGDAQQIPSRHQGRRQNQPPNVLQASSAFPQLVDHDASILALIGSLRRSPGQHVLEQGLRASCTPPTSRYKRS
jgi:hypothetical protein